ncbi:putative toxin-antitoxin system toxin component, PIN family [Spirosoma rhododendri]|uniref:Putative toxin-antitoxin system toxin component, PIN family n=1 Tax=Spirosoma rhododendri TaxID=2728024 RepID=A0A7L5DXB4_9BACT|nr:putative toxin-antitoxin system toxin component, PIN family [Spirosoma rhododendri]QJD80617.1 putative toxin-antitoxin system toxin component, PIN family [Spirosoma rhododendri]
MRPTIVFDTNGLVSAALLAQSVSRRAFDKAYQHGQLITSAACLAELTDVLHRPKFSRYLTPVEADLFISRYAGVTLSTHIHLTIDDCRDKKDNKFLETAVCGEADYIITGDLDLLCLHPFRGISIITPADFLELPLQSITG